MLTRRLIVLLILLVTRAAATQAQAPDFSGTWSLNRSASQMTAGTGIAGLGAGGAPNTLYISQAANGVVVVGSDVNESLARTFRMANGTLRGEESTAKESFSLAADGQTLTITVTGVAASGDAVTSTLVYTRTHVEAPCEKWPTPCRYTTGPRF